MLIEMLGKEYDFRPWRPTDGPVHRSYAFDTETTRIDDAHPEVIPAYVMGATFDGQRGYFISREHVEAFLRAHDQVPAKMHNAPFDLAVLQAVAPRFDVYQLVDQHGVYDTQLMHRLYMLGTAGHTALGEGRATLERCAELYLDVALEKEVRDHRGNDVRLSWGQWLGKPPASIDRIYLDYLGRDVITTHLVYRKLHTLTLQLLRASDQSDGFVSPEWLAGQEIRWGPQTLFIQLQSAIVLRQISANGLHVDQRRREDLVGELEALRKEREKELRQDGLLVCGSGSAKALQRIFKDLERDHASACFPRTESGQYATSHEALVELSDVVPFAQRLLEYRTLDKLLGSFLGKMGRSILHPSFDVLKTTGRTSSFGDLNAQNLPRDERVRNCFVPSPGHVFVQADYATVELATLAQSCLTQFDLTSEMAAAINSSKDLHVLVAAQVTGKDEADVTKDERQRAKPINFGKPGGMGNATLRRMAKSSYGLDLGDDEVDSLSEAWFAAFPEMHEFLGRRQGNPLEKVAALFGLTPASHYMRTGDDRFQQHNVGREDEPLDVLGGMFLKAIKQADPTTTAGRPYADADIGYFWGQLMERANLFPPRFQTAVASRQPSVGLQRAVMRIADAAPVFTLTGRLRANASFCARCNTVFQGLAADGAKLALWELHRAGYRIVNFVHDEVLIEVAEDDDLDEHVETIKRFMVDAMREVVPNVLIQVEAVVTTCWSKKAEPVFDNEGRIVPWSPPDIIAKPKPRKRRPLAATSSAADGR